MRQYSTQSTKILPKSQNSTLIKLTKKESAEVSPRGGLLPSWLYNQACKTYLKRLMKITRR